MKKVIVVGGNQSGLNMARCLGEIGMKVTVFEKKKCEDVAYDWTDDIDPAIFGELGIDMPPKECYSPKKNWTFVNPRESVKIRVNGGQQNGDISIFRRPLNDYLRSLIGENVEIYYEAEVGGLVFDKDVVKGVKINGESFFADLVVDCSGVNSVLRKSMPKESGIQNEIGKGETFVAYRGFFKGKEGVEKPEMTNKAYLQHAGEKGISWCIYDDKEDIVDILIGRIDELSDETVDRALQRLKIDNPILSDELVKCGFKSHIPVRYPISRMVANGYVLCGDSAFMTIPMMGSGIVCALTCGKILAEVLKENDDCGVNNLWNYQVKYYQKFATYLGVDLLKRWLLKVNADDVDYLFESGVLDEGMLAGGAGGNEFKMTIGTLLKKAWQGRKRVGLLLDISATMGKSSKANELARNIPTVYEETAVNEWQKGIESFFN